MQSNNNINRTNNINDKKVKGSQEKEILYMIPKIEKHIQYVLLLVDRMPRIEKFNIGNELKNTCYDTLKNILYVSKLPLDLRLSLLNSIDANICYEKCILRIMYNKRYIDNKKYIFAMRQLIELGNMTGGYIKYLNAIGNNHA